MSDLIRREDAIRWVKTECNPYGKPTLDFESGKKVIEHLEHMPSADRWIPCSERLPKDWEHVLVCTTVTYTTPIFVDWYVDEIGSWANEGDSVIAWMPLPKPWKGADDEGHDISGRCDKGGQMSK